MRAALFNGVDTEKGYMVYIDEATRPPIGLRVVCRPSILDHVLRLFGRRYPREYAHFDRVLDERTAERLSFLSEGVDVVKVYAA